MKKNTSHHHYAEYHTLNIVHLVLKKHNDLCTNIKREREENETFKKLINTEEKKELRREKEVL